MIDEDGYDPELFWNPAPKPTPPVVREEVTPAMDRARRAMGITGFDQRGAYLVLGAALDVEEMAQAMRDRDAAEGATLSWGEYEIYADRIRTMILGES